MMHLRYAVTAAAIGLSLAGCQRTAYDNDDTSYSRPTPLQAQPVPSVQSSALPPTNASASQFPAPPSNAPSAASQQQQQAMAASAQDVTKESMVGSWKVSNGGASCDMFLTLTNLGGGSRGGTRGCSGELTSMGSWEVSGKQIILKNRDGTQIGSLYKTAASRYDGSTASGQPLSLSR